MMCCMKLQCLTPECFKDHTTIKDYPLHVIDSGPVSGPHKHCTYKHWWWLVAGSHDRRGSHSESGSKESKRERKGKRKTTQNWVKVLGKESGHAVMAITLLGPARLCTLVNSHNNKHRKPRDREKERWITRPASSCPASGMGRMGWMWESCLAFLGKGA